VYSGAEGSLSPYGVTGLADSCQGDHRKPDLGPIASTGPFTETINEENADVVRDVDVLMSS